MAKSATPDVIIIEEANDQETMSMLIDTAQSGVAVLSTLHISRITDIVGAMMTYYPDAGQREARLQAVLESLQVILVQRLEPGIIDGDPTRKKGRVCLREYLILDDSMRRKILALPSRKWARVLDEMVGNHGCRMVDSARKLFSEGRLSKSHLERIEMGRST